MALITLTSKYVDVGSTGGYGFALYGYRNIGGSFGTFGTLSETANGSSNDTTSNWYSSSTQILEVYWADQSTDTLYLTVAGNRSNSLWTNILIGSSVFTRSTATYSYNSSTNRTTWSWVTSTNPFGTTNGSDVAVDIRIDLNTGHTGSVSPTTLTATETTTTVYTLGNAGSTKYRIIKETGTTPSTPDGGTVNSRTGSGTINIPTAAQPTAGNTATYQVQIGGSNSQTSDDECWIDTTGQTNSFSITRQSASSTYSVTAPASINEGSAGTINVTTTNVTNGTTLYYTVSPSGDFGTSSGSFTINSNAGSFTLTPTADSTTEGAETATVSIRTGSTSGTVVATDTFTINDTSTTPVPTYSINAPASINEGSAGTINVTTTNVSNGTTLYWDLDQSTDYSTSQGSVSISSNAASFTITPTADSTTEGAETDTIRLYTDSSRTTEVANDSFTINDTSTGSGGSSSGSDGSSTYGLQVTGPNGTTTVFSSNLRQMNAVLLASTTLTSQASVSYTGIAEATNSSKIAVVVSKQNPSYLANQGVTVARSTANGGTITLTNVSTSSVSIKVTIYRIA